MPLCTVALPVSNLPQSTSFFLSALHPLGYRYLSQRGDNQIGFGVDEADFFLYQERPGTQVGTADISFGGSSRAAVDAFYSAALRAGGVSHILPGPRGGTDGQAEYSAAVFDIDGNSIRVVWKRNDEPAGIADGAAAGSAIMDDSRRSVLAPSRTGIGSRVLTWQQNVARSGVSDRRTVVGSPSRALPSEIGSVRALPAPQQQLPLMETGSYVGGNGSISGGGSRSVFSGAGGAGIAGAGVSAGAGAASGGSASASGNGSGERRSSSSSDLFSAKAILGTLLGAAGGAAVAYAMMRAESEEDLQREQAAMRERPTHHIAMVDREAQDSASLHARGPPLPAPPSLARIEAAPGSPASIAPSARSALQAGMAAAASAMGQDGANSSVARATAAVMAAAAAADQPSPARSLVGGGGGGVGGAAALGTLISTFIPPSVTGPRLLEANGAASASPSASPSAVGGGSVIGGGGGGGSVAPRSPSVMSSATVRSALNTPLPSSRAASTTMSTSTAKPPAATPSSPGGGGGAASAAGSAAGSAAPTTIVAAARNTPLPPSSRVSAAAPGSALSSSKRAPDGQSAVFANSAARSVVTVTPSESISNVSSRRPPPSTVLSSAQRRVSDGTAATGRRSASVETVSSGKTGHSRPATVVRSVTSQRV